MDDHGPTFLGVVVVHSLAEVQQGRGVVGHTVVGPLEEVELLHLPHRHLGTALTRQLQRRQGEWVD